MTDRDGNTPWELPKDGNQWESPDSSGYGWRFPFRDDELDDNGPDDSETGEMPVPGATPAPAPDSSRDVTSDDATSDGATPDDVPTADEEDTREMPVGEPAATDPEPSTDTLLEPAHAAPSDTETEHNPSPDADSAYATSPTADTRETPSKVRGMGKGAVAALAIGVAIVAAAAGFGGGWFLQQPKIDEAHRDTSRLANQLHESEETRTGSETSLSSLRKDYKNALISSNGWPICNVAGYGDPSQGYWYFTSGDLEGLLTAAGVGCQYTVEDTGQLIFILSGLSTEEAKKNVANGLEDGSKPDDKHGYRFINYVDNGVWIIVQGPNEAANKQTADEVESKLKALKDQTPES